MTRTRQIRLFALSFLLFTGLAKSIACAGDYASRNIIGFSPDGRYFAFEQYGIQDGSGFPYSEIFVLDTADDRWVEGTPIRKREDNEAAKLSNVRKKALSAAGPTLAKFGISRPGDLLASNPRAELSADPHRVVVNAAHQFTPPKREPIGFRLTEKRIDPGECGQYTDRPIKGFNLTMEPAGGEPITLHDETQVPTSRGCTLGYAIADILSYEDGGKTTWAVLLHVQTVGFEGPNSRFLAVTRRLP
jgi:predicted secreted protein